MQSCLTHSTEEKPPLLQVNDFKVYYPIHKGIFKRIVDHVRAVDGVSFDIQQGKTLALVGESGCGKTTLGKSLLNLIPGSGGQVKINGVELNSLTGEAITATTRKHPDRVSGSVFIDESENAGRRHHCRRHQRLASRALIRIERKARVRQLLQQVDLPEDSAQRYPHEFSGGQRQRICIARALAVEPKLIVCDEPTSALDVSVQAQIIQLLKTLQQEKGVSYLFITHDLAVVAEIADDVAVMYQGKIVEQGSVAQVLTQPEHAYTRKLLEAVPVLKTEK